MRITKAREYVVNGKRVSLGNHDVAHVYVLSPEKTDVFLDDTDGFLKNKAYIATKTSYVFVNQDSFEAARRYGRNPLVMNFASARHPGGGFRTGASAQEESLCRASTLYASLTSQDAAVMYDFNNMHELPAYSDYMLLSDQVAVFRDASGALLPTPFSCGVITVPAPNRNGSARSLSKEELDDIIHERLRRMLLSGIRYRYHTIVLGAWGCGVFGNPTEEIAEAFHRLLIEEGLGDHFDTVVFAVYRDEKKLSVFRKTFKDVAE